MAISDSMGKTLGNPGPSREGCTSVGMAVKIYLMMLETDLLMKEGGMEHIYQRNI